MLYRNLCRISMGSSPFLSATLNRCVSLPILLLCFLLFAAANAERDFNVNDSQVPVIEPKDAPAYQQDPYVTELMHCQHAPSEIVLSLLLRKHDWSDLSVAKRQHVQAKLSKFFAIPKEFITLDSVGKRELYSIHKLAMRKGGKGQKHTETIHRRLGRASFMIGCGANYFSMGEPIAKQIAHQIKDGTIGALTEENFGLWYIWHKELKNRSQRKRRQLEGSGAEEEDYDYGDDDDEQSPEPTEVPTTHAHRHHHGVAKEAAGEAGEPVDALEAAINSSSLPSLVSNELGGTPTTTLLTHSTTRQPETSSTTDASTDYVEPRQENSSPIIKMRLQKLAVTSGKAFSFVVPEETFIDAEDQTNLRLELTDKSGQELKPTSWLQFNADKREIYGLPLDDAVSRWEYRLSATDSGNASVTETVEISVQQHRAVRTINHEIHITVRFAEKFEHSIDWQLKLIKAVAHVLGDENSAAVVVREIRQTLQEPQSATFVYFNETFSTSECPNDELRDVINRLDPERLSDQVYPQFSIISITGEPLGECAKRNMLAKAKPPVQAKNVPPMPRNQVDRVNASVGTLLVYKVPTDTFYDPNGNDLTLTLKTKEHKELSPRSWLQFDSKNQEFYGVPKTGDVGTEQYLLVAEDTGGLSANDALVVVVSHTPKKDYAVLFKAELAIRHENFNADLQRKFVERIAQLHGDANTNLTNVRSIIRDHVNDNTIVNFYNVSLLKTQYGCPERDMAIVRGIYLTNELKPSEELKRALGPELVLSNFTVVPSFACLNDGNHDISKERIPTRSKEPSLKPAFPDEYLATFILPAIIIVVMILLASIIACCLHRRRHKSGKMELGDEEERKSFRTKGIPVIFQDEFEEKPEIGNKSPVILKDEKPPLLPPSYNTSNMNGDNDVDEYVPPPAVVLGGREVRGKSPATPSYRKPPPYVSP